VVALLALVGFATLAWAQPPEVEVELVPASVGLPSEGEVQVLVIARNRTASSLHDVQLSWFTNAGVDMTVEGPQSEFLVPQGVLAWTLRLSQANEGPVEGTVHVRIDYSWQPESQALAVPGVAHGTLEVTGPEPEPAEDMVQVRVETAVGSLMEHRPGMVYLVVTNVSAAPVQVTEISPAGPEFVTFNEAGLTSGVVLAPREAHAFPFEVCVTGIVRPGKHLLLYQVAFQSERGGRTRAGKAIATHEVQVGVLGESDILTALGVPSFLLLPGFLMLVTAGLLWRFVPARSGDFPLKAKDAEFWLLAITLSLLAAGVYPLATGWAGGARNYLEGYGLRDVMWVWCGSVVLAAVGYLAAIGGLNIQHRLASWYRGRVKPSPTDGPIVVLQKLHRQDLGVRLPRVKVEVGGEVQQGFLLEPQAEGQQWLRVGPNIVVKWLPGASRDLRRKVGEQLEADRGAGELGKLLEDGERQGVLQVNWKPTGKLKGPYHAEAEHIQEYLAPALIIHEE
jgi:hypothetical protein